jgi:carboxylesterase
LTSAIHAFQRLACGHLLAWGGLCIISGWLFILAGDRIWTGFGIQILVWGLIQAGLGISGWVWTNRSYSQPNLSGLENRDPTRITLLLKGGIWLGLGAILIGTLWLKLGIEEPAGGGLGLALLVQGIFLVLFGWQHLLRTPSGQSMNDPTIFADPKHSGFVLKSGTPAAVLVHGFPGTPNEIRSVAEALHENGWTVQGLLLPGFGPQLDTLGQKKYEDWLEQVVCAVDELRREHFPVLLVGFSMGGALAVKAAALARPDGVVLLAPFLWLDSLWQRLLLPVVPRILPAHIRPFRGINFSNPYARSSIKTVISQVDIENHHTRKALRQLRFPLSAVLELRRAGIAASAALPDLNLPTLVIQGRHDPLVRRKRTYSMLPRFPSPPAYLEVDARHDLTAKDEPAWKQVRSAVVDFAKVLQAGEPPHSTKAVPNIARQRVR